MDQFGKYQIEGYKYIVNKKQNQKIWYKFEKNRREAQSSKIV